MEFLLEYFYPHPLLEEAPLTTTPARPPAFDNTEQQKLWQTACSKCPYIESSFYLDIIKSAPEEHITPILEGLNIFTSISNKLTTLEHTALLTQAGLYASSFARGYSKLLLAVESKKMSYGLSELKVLLLESEQHAGAIGEALALSLNCCGTRIFDALSFEFFISLVQNQPLAHRHSLIIGLINLFLCNPTLLTQKKACLLSQIAPVAAEFSLFWSALCQIYPNEATDDIFNLLIENPTSFKKLLPIIEDPIISNFISRGYLAQMIEHPNFTQHIIKMFRCGSEALTVAIWECRESYPYHNQAVLDILFILYGSNALSHNTVSLLKDVGPQNITQLNDAMQHISYWICEQSFAVLCDSSAQDMRILSHRIKQNAEERFLSQKDCWIEKLVSEISSQNTTNTEKDVLRNLTVELLRLSEGQDQAETFLFIVKVIKTPCHEAASKIGFLREAIENLQEKSSLSQPALLLSTKDESIRSKATNLQHKL